MSFNRRQIVGFRKLVQEQLDAHHMEKQTSLWNSLVFVVKKNSGKWRMVTDLKAVNKVIQPMGSLPSGIPLLSLFSKGCPLIVIDFKIVFSLYIYKTRTEKNLHS